MNPVATQVGPVLQDRLQSACLELEAWLESARVPGGYGGPVAHWWWDSLDYGGPGLDWRYEGIILGYLDLWQASGQSAWLDKACRAGDDLLRGQLPSGNFRNSQFELNPGSGGTPHEAACDLALIRLAQSLQRLERPAWQDYAAAAQRNLQEFYIARLWDTQEAYFRDHLRIPGFVPNKAATLAEALFALAALRGEPAWIERYALPTLERILEHQVAGGDLDGAIYQNSFGGRQGRRMVARFFPYYIARCLPGLLLGWEYSGSEVYAQAARRAARFILRTRYPEGSFPQVLYRRGRLNRYPQWVAGVGDILRALDQARQVGFEYDPAPSQEWLLAGLLPEGGMRTAYGFGRVRPGGAADDPRDTVCVCGWVDKAFRYLCGRLAAQGMVR